LHQNYIFEEEIKEDAGIQELAPAGTTMLPGSRKRKLKKMRLHGPYRTTEDLQILMHSPTRIGSKVHLQEHYFF
jgi:hypothetical protein